MDFDHYHFCLSVNFLKFQLFGKVSFNLIKLSVFCLISFFFCYFLFLFGRSFLLFLPVSEKLPPRKIDSRLGLRFRIALGLGFKNVRFHPFIICPKLHLFVCTKRTKWSKLDDAHIFESKVFQIEPPNYNFFSLFCTVA